MFLMGYILLSYGINIAFRIYTSFQISSLSAEVPRCGDLFFCIYNLLFAPAFGFFQLNIESLSTHLTPTAGFVLSPPKRVLPEDYANLS